MTEKEIRANFAKVAQSYIGTIKGSVKHKELVDIYNSYRPLPRGYKLSYNDHWCAGFVSSNAIQCKVDKVVPIECSCTKMVELYKNLGRWVEDDAYDPEIADILFYRWDDGADYKTTDQKKNPNHVGIIVEKSGEAFTVVEGNRVINGLSQVAYRTMQVNGRYIRGYGIPDYASIADKPKAPWYEEPMKKAKELGLLDGTRPLDNLTRAEAATIALRLYDLLS